ncbi:MAG: CDP-alcohol phosphatidyltransferase family protein [Desulfobulbaceae bacterium]|nr:CDP-alcohol phosphatidyltransferase family protein [Desulfobulbaceae bacterium]HIJ79065.1 CDP-alcohol phosphatidyltransferase family protein [Deltaproteobacteria bacterium]
MGANQLFTIPNLLSCLRLLISPVLVIAAWLNQAHLFVTLFIICLVTDALDGFFARRLKQTSELGAKLDSWGDLALFCTVPFGLWLLWPQLIRQELLFVIFALAALLTPLIAGLIKFRRITSYHTIGAKLSAVLLAAAIPLLLMGGPAWPFRLAVIVLLAAELEELMITFHLKKWQANIPSLGHLRKRANEKKR